MLGRRMRSISALGPERCQLVIVPVAWKGSKMDATEGVFADVRRNTTLPITPEHAPIS